MRLPNTPETPRRGPLRPVAASLCCLLLALAGCETTEDTAGGADTRPDRAGLQRSPFQTSPLDPPIDQARPARAPVSVVRRGNDRFIGRLPPLDPELDPRRDSGETYSVNLVNVGIADAARAVLGEALGVQYIVEEGVAGQVSLETSRGVGRAALLEAFQASLELTGAAIVRNGNVYAIRRLSEAAANIVPLRDRRGLGRRVVVVPLVYIGTEEMLRILGPLTSEGTILNANAERNVILVSGPQAEVDAVIEAVNIFDVDVLHGKSVALYRLNSASPDAVAAELTRIFGAETGGSLSGVISFVPNDRLGSILVITSRQRYLARAEQWIRQLDRSADPVERHTVIYRLDNRSATDLVPVLTDLIEAWPSSADVLDETGEGNLVLDDGVTTVVADDTSNAVVAWASASEHEELARLIRRLDWTPAQVLLEATIAEVRLNDDLRLGLRWFFESGNFELSFSDLASGAVTPSFPGFSFLFNDGSAVVALNALSKITDVNMVSTPSILVLDNRVAELRVGDQVPIATQSAVSVEDPTAPIVNSISFRDTGVILKIRPRVSRSGRVIMDVEQEVSSSSQTEDSNIDSPTISQRILKTSVAVDDGETLALGGLIEESQTLTRSQVPLLGDIPGLGLLFKNKADDAARSELLILITPRVIRDPRESQRITDEYRRRLQRPDTLVGGGAHPRHNLHRLLR